MAGDESLRWYRAVLHLRSAGFDPQFAKLLRKLPPYLGPVELDAAQLAQVLVRAHRAGAHAAVAAVLDTKVGAVPVGDVVTPQEFERRVHALIGSVVVAELQDGRFVDWLGESHPLGRPHSVNPFLNLVRVAIQMKRTGEKQTIAADTSGVGRSRFNRAKKQIPGAWDLCKVMSRENLEKMFGN